MLAVKHALWLLGTGLLLPLVVGSAVIHAAETNIAENAGASSDKTMASAMGINAYYKDFFADLTKSSQISSLDKTPLQLDDDGWPKNDCGVEFGNNGGYRTGHAPDISGVYTISFQCDNPDVQVKSSNAANSVVAKTGYDLATKTWTGTLTIPPATAAKGCSLHLNFTDTHSGIRKLRFLRPGCALTTPETEVYAPFKAMTAPFGGAMRPTSDQGQGTMPYPALRQWASRVDLPYLPAPFGQNMDGSFPCWEWQVILANELNRDLWICVPINATDDYLSHLAHAIKDGSSYHGRTFPPLKPGLKLYVEYSNEVWNFGFYQFKWNLFATRDALFQGNLDGPYYRDLKEVDAFDADYKLHYVARSVEMSRIFRSVFGDEQMMTRIRPVLFWQENNGQTSQSMGEYVAQFYGPPQNFFYGIGDAPYLSPMADTVDGMYQDAIANLDDYAKTHWRQAVAGAMSVGLPYICYEGGGFNRYSKPAKQAQFDWLYDPRIKDLVKRYWLDFAAAGGTQLAWTGLHGHASENSGGAWGIVEDIFHPDQAPRWVAVKELAPMERPTLQTAATIDGRQPAIINLAAYPFPMEHDHPANLVKDCTGRLYKAVPVPQYTLTINVSEPGAYAITLTGNHFVTGSDHSSVRVRIDGQAIGELSLPQGGDPQKNKDWAKSSTAAVAMLTPGLHAVQLRFEPVPRRAGGRQIQDLIIAPAAELPKLAPGAAPAIDAIAQRGRILVAWEPAAQNGHPLLGYNLYRGSAGGPETLYKKSLPPTLLSFIDTGLKTGEAFSYHVTASNEIGESVASASVSASAVEKPAMPTGLKAQVAAGPKPGTTIVTLTWDKAADHVECYAIYFAAKPGGVPQEANQYWKMASAAHNTFVFADDSNPWRNAGVTATDLYFQIAAVNGAGQGPRSAELHVDAHMVGNGKP